MAVNEELVRHVPQEHQSTITRLAELKEESRRLTAELLKSGDASTALLALRVMCW